MTPSSGAGVTVTPGERRQPYHDELLHRLLETAFPGLDAAAVGELAQALTWVEVAGGEALLRQGEAGDAMYLLVGGRLRAYVQDPSGGPRLAGEVARGEIVGEISLFTEEPRMASVFAVRDSLLVRLDKADFDLLLARHPAMARELSRQVIRRLKAPGAKPLYPRPITIGLLPVSAGVDLARFAATLARELAHFGRTELIDAEAMQRLVDKPDATLGPGAMMEAHRRIALALDRVEARSEFVLFVADQDATAWTARCCRDADELILIADADQPAALHPIERLCLMPRASQVDAAEILVLLHSRARRMPRGTRAWLDRRPLAGHLHMRPSHEADMARLARFLNRSGTGLVLAGGGARGLAHLGVLRALRERGIEIDAVGGTSIGAVMATYVASDRPQAEVEANARSALARNPTGDLSSMPWLSLFRGARLRRTLEASVQELLGHDGDVEDLWKTAYFVVTNFSQAQEQVLWRGRLVRMLQAATAIPGALPPLVHKGELLCDGGTFNNFPVDVMRAQRGIGKVIGVDLDYRQPLKVELEELPGGWTLLRDQWRSPRKRRYQLPSLPTYLMTVMVLYSTARSRRSRAQTDLYFNPPLERVGLLQWKRFEQIVQRGYAHAKEVLDRQPDIALPP